MGLSFKHSHCTKSSSTMRICLQLALLTFMTSLTSAEVKVESHDVVRETSLDGKVSDEHLLFRAEVSSRLACASNCLKYDCCAAFSTSPKDPTSSMVTCRGHDSKFISQSSTVDVQGSETYFVKNKPIESSWLRRPCANNSHCPATVTNVTCFANECLCQPGFYYSHCRDDCVLDCASQDLQTAFLAYEGLSIDGSNLKCFHESMTFEAGREYCLEYVSQCRTFEVTSSYCCIQDVTMLDPGIDIDTSNNYVHYQRTCY